MKFTGTTGFIVSILTASVYGLATAPYDRESADIEGFAGPAQGQIDQFYTGTSYGTDPGCGDPRRAVPLLRAFNVGHIDHFYTANATEFTTSVNYHGYSGEGTAGYVFSAQEPHSVPLYRTWSYGARNHFYTTNSEERDRAVKYLGYQAEGVVGYVYPDSVCGGSPLYRLYRGSGQDHFYTMSVAERDHASKNLGYAPEGIAGREHPG